MKNSSEYTLSEVSRKKCLVSETYFGRSWTHIFYCWKRHRIMLAETTRKTLAKIGSKTARVVELGCSSGNGLFEAFDVCVDLNDVHWYGLDLDLNAISAGSSRSRIREIKRGSQPVNFMAGDLCRLPFIDRSFDMVLCCEVLEHLLDPRFVITEIARVLRPGGHFFMTTPNSNDLVERLGYAIDKILHGALKRLFWSGHDQVSAPPLKAEVGFGHVSVHPYRIWRTWLEEAGLQVVRRVRGPMFFGGPFFDRWRFISGCLIALDPLLDFLPGRFLFSNNLGILCCKSENSEP